jgi:hypothetical protein
VHQETLLIAILFVNNIAILFVNNVAKSVKQPKCLTLRDHVKTVFSALWSTVEELGKKYTDLWYG